jgi:hypothetical protein
MNKRRFLTFVLLVSLTLVSSPRVAQGSPVPLPVWSRAEASRVEGADAQAQHNVEAATAPAFGKLPLSFVPNAGQTDPAVRFQVHSPVGTLSFTSDEVVLSLPTPVQATDRSAQRAVPGGVPDPNAGEPPGQRRDTPTVPPAPPTVLRLRFEGANPAPELTGAERLPGIVNYFIGNDPAKWRTNLPTYAGVAYQELYPGIDLHYDGVEGVLKGTYTVAPGADPSHIRWRYDGATSVSVDEATGDLLIRLPTGAGADGEGDILTERAPVAWQRIDGQRVPVNARYTIAGDGSIGFALGDYDPAHPLTLDPTLIYSTYLGGSGTDMGNGIAVDSAGNVYVTGLTYSTDFPTESPRDGTLDGSEDVFVTKLNAAGSALLYSTYLGGSGTDEGQGIAVDSAGNAYITGWTNSTDFPKINPWDNTLGGRDAFVAKLNAAGSDLLYSTYLGGSSIDTGEDIAVDSGDRAYVVGHTFSTDFPTTTVSLQATYGGGTTDAFVAKLSAVGSALLYSTYLGGSDTDEGQGIALNDAGNAHVTGWTTSNDFPTASPLQPSNNGGPHDAFVAKLNAAGSGLLYSTYLGGSGVDTGDGIAVDSSGNTYVTGQVRSTDFPTKSPLQPAHGGGLNDAFVAKLNPTGSTLFYSTYLGGDNSDSGYSIAADDAGNAYVTGFTESTTGPNRFPADELWGTPGGDRYAFVTKLSEFGSALLYSTFLGGGTFENLQEGHSVAVDDRGDAYVTGWTDSSSFPTESPLYSTLGGGSDAFVTQILHSDIGFRPDPHGYQFRNWGEVNYNDYTMDDMRRMFGDDCVCYMSAGSCSSYRLVASQKNKAWNEVMGGGHCYGMAVTSLRFFKGLENPFDFQAGTHTTHDLQKSNIRRHIAYYFVEQFVDPANAYIHNSRQNAPSVILDQLHLAMAGNVLDPPICGLFFGRYGHAVTPYAIQHRGGGVYWIWVYDNNCPDDADRHVIVNAANNTWSYGTWSGDFTTHSILIVPISQNPEHPPCPSGWSSSAYVGSTLNETPSAQVWLTGQSHLLITDAQGRRTGYVSDQFVNEIPGARATPVIGGLDAAIEPVYSLPLSDTYTILMDGQTLTQTETVKVAQFGPGYATSLDGVTLGPASQDQLIIAPDGTQLAYQPSGDGEATLILALDGASEGNELQVEGADIRAGQVVTLTTDVDSGQLVFNNAQADGGEYDLKVRRVSAAGEQTFIHTGLVISATDTHYLDYDAWDGSGSMTLHIDHGSDGTIDETFEVPNMSHPIYLPLIFRTYIWGN